MYNVITWFYRKRENIVKSSVVTLYKISNHESESDCKVCQQEESKSPSLKINGTKILERVILPPNECWICNLKFEDSASQVNHFADNHE